MGSTQAYGFAEAVREGQCSLAAALTWQVTANFYPPLPREYANYGAIALADPTATISLDPGLPMLPKAVRWEGDTPVIEASTLIEILRLEAFMDDQDEEEY